MVTPNIRAEMERVLAEGATRAKAEIDRAALLALEIALCAGREHDNDMAPQPDQPKWISLEQAAPIRGVTRQTMALHAEKFGLGTYTDRRWRIDETRVRALNAGRPYAKLNPFPDGET